MTSYAISRQYGLFLTGGKADTAGRRLRKTVMVSLVIHLCILALIAGFRLRKSVERPLSAVQVTLVAPPTQETAKTEPRVEKARPSPKPVQAAPIPVPPKPVQPPPPAPPQAKPAPIESAPPPPRPAPVLTQPAPPTPTLAVPQPIPQSVKTSASAPILSRKDVMQDLLKDIELPHNPPKFGDLSPAKPAESRRAVQTKLDRVQERPQNDLDAVLNKLKVPEMTAPIEVPKEQIKPVPAPPKLPSLAEEMDRELKELKTIQAPPTIRMPDAVQTKPMFREQPQAAAPPVIASVPRVKAPATKMQVSNMSSGSNAYLALVQRAINERWTAPPVDISGAALTVVIKFRLSRTGTVSGVLIDRQSGNEYYDLAARRAVLSAEHLPAFPSHITDPYYDIYFTFAVGEAG